MDRPADSDEIPACCTVARGERAECLSPARQVRTDVPERLPVMPGESDLVLLHLGEALATIFSP